MLRKLGLTTLVAVLLLALAGSEYIPDLGAADDAILLIDSGQTLGVPFGHEVALGDLDGDGDLDAYVADRLVDTVWLNDGNGFFSSNGQFLDTDDSREVVLVDIDNDDDLDAIVARKNTGNVVMKNDGNGQFTNTQTFGTGDSVGLDAGDIDGDNDPDVIVVGTQNQVWLNANGTLVATPATLGSALSWDVALADLDGDGDLDAYLATTVNGNTPAPDQIWLNQGINSGNFADSGQRLGASNARRVALGNLNADTSVDAFLANVDPFADTVWLNDGSANFSDSGQRLGDVESFDVALGDLDGDGDLDAFTGNHIQGNYVWENMGNGSFQVSGEPLGDDVSYGVALGDLDGDGDLDVFVANWAGGRVFLNGGASVDLPLAIFDVRSTQNENGDDVYFWAMDGDIVLPVFLSKAAPVDMDVVVEIHLGTDVITRRVPFSIGEQFGTVTLTNPNPFQTNTVELVLLVAVQGQPPQAETDRLLLSLIPAEETESNCSFCFLLLLANELGLPVDFADILAENLSSTELKESSQWDFYRGIYRAYSPELSAIAVTNPDIAWDAIQLLNDLTPGIVMLDTGQGDKAMVTADMVNDTNELLSRVKSEGSLGLSQAIANEEASLNLDEMAGKSMDDAWQQVQTARPMSNTYIVISLSDGD